ncbi:MAG: hypothetical protein Q9166_001033 [cf. Caloplaca sp. 2 TL-2023]
MSILEGYHVGKLPRSMDRPESVRQSSRKILCDHPLARSANALYRMQAATNALLAGGSVVWIDASYAVNARWLKNLLDRCLQADKVSTQVEEPEVSSADLLTKFHHFITPTLPHLAALLLHSTSTFPPEGTSLLVVDSISTSFNQVFAHSNKHAEDKPLGKKFDTAQWASSRRWAVMADLISAIGKLAATRSLTVILTSQTTTKMRLENTALLQPAMSGMAWEAGISCRLVLYRDWRAEVDDDGSHRQKNVMPDLRFAAVIKIGGQPVDGFGEIVPFTVDDGGLREMVSPVNSMHEPVVLLQVGLKRKRGEVADSASDSGNTVSDDGFGWVANDALAEKERLTRNANQIVSQSTESCPVLLEDSTQNSLARA